MYRWGKILAVSFVLLIAAALWWSYHHQSETTQIRARLRAAGVPMNSRELDASYTRIPDSDNAALVILEGASRIQRATETNTPLFGFGDVPARGKKWSPEILAASREALAANSNVLVLLRKGLALPKSRYPIDLSKGFTTLLPHLALQKKCASLLSLDAAVSIHENRATDSVTSILNLLQLARSLDQESLLISQLVNFALRQITVSSIQRTLNLSQLPADQLLRLQTACESARNNRLLHVGLLGEFANGQSVFQMSPGELTRIGGIMPVNPGNTWQASGVQLAWLAYSISGLKAADELSYLRIAEKFLAASEEPWAQRRINMLTIEEMITKLGQHPLAGILSKMFLPALAKAYAKEMSAAASLDCAIVGLALERYRQDNGDALPDSLAVLVPKYIGVVPEDPWNGKSLVYRPLTHGFIVYSVGEDQKDDGGIENVKNRVGGFLKQFDLTFIVDRLPASGAAP